MFPRKSSGALSGVLGIAVAGVFRGHVGLLRVGIELGSRTGVRAVVSIGSRLLDAWASRRSAKRSVDSNASATKRTGSVSAVVGRRVRRRFRDGDPDAVRTVYRSYGRLVYAVAYRVLGDRGLAEEATQLAFVKP